MLRATIYLSACALLSGCVVVANVDTGGAWWGDWKKESHQISAVDSIEFDARGVRAEYESVLFVVKAIENDLETVRVLERRIPAAVCNNNSCRIIVETNYADIERLVCESNIDLGSLGRRATFIGPNLPEARSWQDTTPGNVASNLPVYPGRRRQPKSLCHRRCHGGYR